MVNGTSKLSAHQPAALRRASMPPRAGRRPIGPFTFLVLDALRKLPPAHRYGAAIEEHLSARIKQLVDLAQVYVTLKRLEGKQLIAAKEMPAPSGSAHTVVCYTITAKGNHAFTEAIPLYRQVGKAARS